MGLKLRSFKYIKTKYPQILILGIVSFFTDVASEMLYPVIPIFLTTVLGASMTNLGIVEGIAEGLSSLLKTYSGYWSDKISKRLPFLFLGYLISAISRPMIGLSSTFYHVLGARSLDRIGKGLRTAPRDALIADIVEIKDRGLAFGWHRFMDTLGAVIGPLICLLILNYYIDIKEIFFWAIIPGLLSVLAILFLSETPMKKNFSSKFELKWKDFSFDFKYYQISWMIFCLTNSSDAFLILKMRHSGISISNVLLIYAFYNFIYALFSPYFGGLSDKLGKRKILIFGACIFSIVYIGFAFSNLFYEFIFLMFLYGIYMASTEGVSKAYVSELVPSHLKASALGIFGTIIGISQIAASVLVGFIWDKYGANYAILVSSIGSISFIFLSVIKTKVNLN